MRNLCDEFKYYRGQPIEVITEDHKYCGIDVDSDADSVLLLDKCARLIRIENRHIEAFIQPQMALNPLCKNVDCPCEYSYCNGYGSGNGNGNGNGDCNCD